MQNDLTDMDQASRKPSLVWQSIRTYHMQIVAAVVVVVILVGAISLVAPYHRERTIALRIKSVGGDVVWGYSGPKSIPFSIREQLFLFDRVHSVSFLENGVTDQSPSSEILQDVVRLEHIWEVHLSGHAVDDNVLAKLKHKTRLATIGLNNTSVTDRGLEHLKEMKSLESLFIAGAAISDAGISHLKNLNGLLLLHLTSTKISDAGLQHLQNLTNLSELALDDTVISDNGLHFLKPMTSLTTLILTDTQTTAAGRDVLRQSLPNCQINPNP